MYFRYLQQLCTYVFRWLFRCCFRSVRVGGEEGWACPRPTLRLREAPLRVGRGRAACLPGGRFAVAALCCTEPQRASGVPRSSGLPAYRQAGSLHPLRAHRCGGLPLPSLTRNADYTAITGTPYAGKCGSAVSTCIPSCFAWAISMRSKGSRWWRGSVATS
jgi:hypothetical protein